MTGSLLAERLVASGLDRAELPAKRALYELTVAAFLDIHGDAPKHAWWVPGRLELFGKHTDYAGGRSLLAAVPRGMAVVAGPRGDGTLTVTDARTGERLTLPSTQRAGTQPGWRHYVEVAVQRLARNFQGQRFEGNVVFAGDLPVAAGLSSSTALIVGIATAVSRLSALESHPAWQANIRGALDVAGYLACVENGHTFGTLEGDAGVGTQGGSEDHVAILCATPGHFSAYAFVPIRHLATVSLPPAWQFVIATSAEKAEKTGAAQQAFNRLSSEARMLLAVWNDSETPALSLGAALASAPDAERQLRDLIHRAGGPHAVALERRLTAFAREDARVSRAVDGILATDAALLGGLAVASQEDAQLLLENQVPATTSLARAALAQGAIAACSFGAGFGGSVWALVEREAASGFPARWLGSGMWAAHNTAFVAAPGPPVTELTVV